MKEIEAIRAALAAGPTPGPWDLEPEADAALIAACNFATMAAVLAHIDEQAGRIKQLLVALDGQRSMNDSLSDTLDYLHGLTPEKAAMLRVDAERYQAVRRGQKWSVIDGIGDTLRAEQLDEAIDAAMKETP
jgi:hypothetical protein